MAIQKIDIFNFTVFNNIEISFSKACNVFIGENAKGLISMSEKYRKFPFGKELIDIIKMSEQWQIKKIPDLVEILLELSRNGVQVFLTTHSYIFAKYFEVRRKKNDDILFHSLYKTEDNNVLCESNRNFKDLKQDVITNSFEKLLDEVYVENKECLK